jgi:hypothetical protein
VDLREVCVVLALLAPAGSAGAQSAAPAEAPVAPMAGAPLSALGEESAGAPRLQLYGFADFAYSTVVEEDTALGVLLGHRPSMAIGKLNVYLDARPAPSWRSLIEIRFTYLPHGQWDASGRTDNGVRDYSDSGTMRWGGIVIERAWLEYTFHEALRLQAGQWLTPYGIWNVDHGSPVLIGIQLPYVLQSGLMPQRQTGLQLLGSHRVSDLLVGYHLTFSNGRGPTDQYEDLDRSPGLGGRLYAGSRILGELTLGVSGYNGRYTDRRMEVDATAEALVIREPVTEQYDERVLAADARWEWSGLLVAAEVVHRHRAYTKHGRPMTAAGTPARDDDQYGAYLLLGYRTSFFGIMPYVIGERFVLTTAGDEVPPIVVYYAGLNVAIEPTIALKLEVQHLAFGGSRSGVYSLFNQDLTLIGGQLAWAF